MTRASRTRRRLRQQAEATRPLCRYCGRPLQSGTRQHLESYDSHDICAADPPPAPATPETPQEATDADRK